MHTLPTAQTRRKGAMTPAYQNFEERLASLKRVNTILEGLSNAGENHFELDKETMDAGTEIAIEPIQSRKISKHQLKIVNERLVGIWLRLTQKGQFQHLLEFLDEIQVRDQEAINFICVTGNRLLKAAVLDLKSIYPLTFICEKVPENQFSKDPAGKKLREKYKEELRQQLKRVHYEVLKELLERYQNLETLSDLALRFKNDLSLLSQKLKILYKLDPEGIKVGCGYSFVEKWFGEYLLSENKHKLK